MEEEKQIIQLLLYDLFVFFISENEYKHKYKGFCLHDLKMSSVPQF